MPEIFEMLRYIARRRTEAGRKKGTASAAESSGAVSTPLPAPSDYEAHHAIVEQLERFNGALEPISAARIKALRALEEKGLPIQARVAEQYLRNLQSLKAARQALWCECHMFWGQLALAYTNLLKQMIGAPAREKFKPYLPALALKCIHYTGLSFRWGYHQGQLPSLFGWRRLNKVYRLVERAGVAERMITLNGEKTSCAHEFVRILLLDLIHPMAFKPREIEMASAIMEKLSGLPPISKKLVRQQHTHGIDLSSGHGAFNLDQGWVPGKRLRFLDFRAVHMEIDHMATDMQGNVNGTFCRQLASIIARGGVRRRSPRIASNSRFWVAIGVDAIRKILDPQMAGGSKPQLEPWVSKDESQDGIGFSVADPAPVSAGQLLLASTEPEEQSWQLLVVRWSSNENGRQSIGTQRLSRSPKGVVFSIAGDPDEMKETLFFIPLLDTREGASNVLLPKSAFRSGLEVKITEKRAIYHLRLGRVVEEHGDWVRAGFEVLARIPLQKVA